MQMPEAEQPSMLLTKFPNEIRNAIYEHVFIGSEVFWLTQGFRNEIAQPLLTCKQIFFEALPLFRRSIKIGMMDDWHQIYATRTPRLYRLFGSGDLSCVQHVVHKGNRIEFVRHLESLRGLRKVTYTYEYEMHEKGRSFVTTKPRSRPYRLRHKLWMETLLSDAPADQGRLCLALDLLLREGLARPILAQYRSLRPLRIANEDLRLVPIAQVLGCKLRVRDHPEEPGADGILVSE